MVSYSHYNAATNDPKIIRNTLTLTANVGLTLKSVREFSTPRINPENQPQNPVFQ